MTMTQPTSSAIRQRFLDYFSARGHSVVPSASLVPDDPTLLFANSGMVPFKDTFLGLEERPYRAAASSQKCMRVSGKHNDLENVGPSVRHHTFFEMLGNFSFGGYFKSEAIGYAWDFLTRELGIDPERLVATVHADDDESYALWRDQIGLPTARIAKLGDKDNFWMMADVGPCGYNSEIHFDFGPAYSTRGNTAPDAPFDSEDGRWMEIWNLVFMQFDQQRDGSRRALPRTGVDTGMGLERVSAVLQGVYANYDTDLFLPIMDAVQSLLEHSPDERAAHEIGYRVLADHGRAMTFLIADGVMPGNDGRSYVLRLVMRRAMRFGRQVGFDGPFLGRIVESVIDVMGGAYPQLVERADWIRDVVAEEEARFARTLESGLGLLDEVIAIVKAAGGDAIDGADVFKLYDTFGFPPDLTRVVAEEHGLGIDQAGFDEAMTDQRTRARAGGKFTAGDRAERYRAMALTETLFVGYETTSEEGRVLAILVDGQSVDAARQGDEVEIVLDATSFYAESGGQVGDAGRIDGSNGRVHVTDTVRPIRGVTAHVGCVTEGQLRVGDAVVAAVDTERRDDVRRNHTATHLLHHALQTLVGEHAQQRGSLVAPDRLRFDFAHLKALSSDDIVRIESAVNAMVRADTPVSAAEMPMDRAREAGATMLFGEKYGDVVRVVAVDSVSKELCGGTHVARTGQIGLFLITSEQSVGSGLRRIEALTGREAERTVRENSRRLHALAERVSAQTVDGVEQKVDELLARARELAREVAAARAGQAAAGATGLADTAVDVDGVPVLAATVEADTIEALRTMVDALRAAVPNGVVVVGAVIDGNPRVIAALSDERAAEGLHAGKLVKALAERLGGGGGGRATAAEAGGRDAAALPDAMAMVVDLVRAQRQASVA
ncbi:MAG: alanine--tRNA ligase [Ardenticatenales bacterium]